MSRRSELESVTKPCNVYLEWTSEEKLLTLYDKEQKKKIKIPKSKKYLVLKKLSAITGWNDAQSSGIYSNEVQDLRTQELVVKFFSGGQVAKGLYNNIKDRIKVEGGKYMQSVYCYTEEGKIVCLNLKGGALGEWLEFTQKAKNRLLDEWFYIKDTEERKKGKTVYNVPIFSFDGTLSIEDDVKVEAAFNELDKYYKKYFSEKTIPDEAFEQPETPTEKRSIPKDMEAADELLSFTEADGEDELPF